MTGGRIADRIERLLDRQHALKPITDRLEHKDLTGAIAECDKVAQSDPKWIIDILKLKSAAALDLGDIEAARTVYTEALNLRNDLVWAKLGLARCHQAAGKLDEAKVIVESVLEKNNQFIGAYDLLAQIAESQGKDQEALDALNKSYEVIPSARRSRLVGDAAYRVGDLEQARTAFTKAVSHTRGSLTAQASDALSLAQVHVDAHEPTLALTVLSVAAKDYPDDPYFSTKQAIIGAQAFAGLGDMNSAKAAFESAQKICLRYPRRYRFLSSCKSGFLHRIE